jgi:hypothetical protein
MMERKVGDIFNYEGNTLKVISGFGCEKCYFNSHKSSLTCGVSDHLKVTGYCSVSNREDHDSVEFVKVNNMEKEEVRNLQITLDIAKEWYNGEDEKLKKMAIIAFPELGASIETYQDLIDNDVKLVGYFIDGDSEICNITDTACEMNQNIFCSRAEAESSLAKSKISQLMISYGGKITYAEWASKNVFKYTIERSMTDLYSATRTYQYSFLAFHTPRQRDLFLKKNEELVRQYYEL